MYRTVDVVGMSDMNIDHQASIDLVHLRHFALVPHDL